MIRCNFLQSLKNSTKGVRATLNFRKFKVALSPLCPASGLSAPTLLNGAPLLFQAPQRPPCQLLAFAKKFCLKLNTILKSPDIYILYLTQYKFSFIVYIAAISF